MDKLQKPQRGVRLTKRGLELKRRRKRLPGFRRLREIVVTVAKSGVSQGVFRVEFECLFELPAGLFHPFYSELVEVISTLQIRMIGFSVRGVGSIQPFLLCSC